MTPRFLVVIPTHRFSVARDVIDQIESSLTYPSEFHVLDGRPSKCHALNKALEELLDLSKHDIYTTIDDDILPGENWQHFVACAFDRMPRLGVCGIDYAGSADGEALMARAMLAPVRQVTDIRFRDTTTLQNVAGGCFCMRAALAKQIGPYPFADDGRQHHVDEDGWRCHQAKLRGWRFGYVTNNNEHAKMIHHEDDPQYHAKKMADLEQWRSNPVWR